MFLSSFVPTSSRRQIPHFSTEDKISLYITLWSNHSRDTSSMTMSSSMYNIHIGTETAREISMPSSSGFPVAIAIRLLCSPPPLPDTIIPHPKLPTFGYLLNVLAAKSELPQISSPFTGLFSAFSAARLLSPSTNRWKLPIQTTPAQTAAIRAVVLLPV